ncbi:glyoxylate/hydroxypyruvate reductase A [Hansschlegelia quercus]|uniref:Glyoxylate/hydroxypyruvate reductase A n=2 Tax=Hansschlegelia quercus TaxID=2528245 RepID=A0A4V2JEI2_9HYPH|nr:glyoxylate/hydroxypyruvate reductase A [Hansschlegelia quercus]
MDAEEEASWLDALRLAMPAETVTPFRALGDEARQRAEIAIVANPDPSDIAALPKLAFVHSLWAGVERLVSELGPGAPPIVRLVDPSMGRVMAEAVLAWTHYLQRDMPAYARQQREHRWAPLPYRKPESMIVGLLGLGALGAAAAARLLDAGFRVAGWSRSPKALPGVETFTGDEGLAALLSKSDVVVCLLPLTAATRDLLDARRLAEMKPDAALINFGRGPIVVAADLIRALDEEKLSHAVLDVFDKEPLDQASPFWAHPNVTVLPHITAPTDHATAAAVVASSVRDFRLTGRIPGHVDLTRGY